jgi:hypothetical protein
LFFCISLIFFKICSSDKTILFFTPFTSRFKPSCLRKKISPKSSLRSK